MSLEQKIEALTAALESNTMALTKLYSGGAAPAVDAGGLSTPESGGEPEAAPARDKSTAGKAASGKAASGKAGKARAPKADEGPDALRGKLRDLLSGEPRALISEVLADFGADKVSAIPDDELENAIVTAKALIAGRESAPGPEEDPFA